MKSDIMRINPENEIWSEIQKNYVQMKENTVGMYVCCCDGNVNCAGNSSGICGEIKTEAVLMPEYHDHG